MSSQPIPLQNDVWGKFPAILSRRIVRALMELDATDESPSGSQCDGKFEGIDLFVLGQKLSSFIKMNRDLRAKQLAENAVCALIDSTRGLHEYGHSLQHSQLGCNSVLLLEKAMCEGMFALVECRKPDYTRIIGFAERFIPQEFDVYFTNILSMSDELRPNWPNYWQGILSGCWPDMFVNRSFCEFP